MKDVGGGPRSTPPNIPPIGAVEHAGDPACLIMDCVEGQSHGRARPHPPPDGTSISMRPHNLTAPPDRLAVEKIPPDTASSAPTRT